MCIIIHIASENVKLLTTTSPYISLRPPTESEKKKHDIDFEIFIALLLDFTLTITLCSYLSV